MGDWQYSGWRDDIKAGRLLRLTYREEFSRSQAGLVRPGGDGARVPGVDGRAGPRPCPPGPGREDGSATPPRRARKGRHPPPCCLLGDSGARPQARWHAIWALDAIDGGVAARIAVLDAATDRDASVRSQAVRQLGTRRVAGARDRLLGRVEDTDAAVRVQAANALGRIGAARGGARRSGPAW